MKKLDKFLNFIFRTGKGRLLLSSAIVCGAAGFSGCFVIRDWACFLSCVGCDDCRDQCAAYDEAQCSDIKTGCDCFDGCVVDLFVGSACPTKSEYYLTPCESCGSESGCGCRGCADVPDWYQYTVNLTVTYQTGEGVVFKKDKQTYSGESRMEFVPPEENWSYAVECNQSYYNLLKVELDGEEIALPEDHLFRIEPEWNNRREIELSLVVTMEEKHLGKTYTLDVIDRFGQATRYHLVVGQPIPEIAVGTVENYTYDGLYFDEFKVTLKTGEEFHLYNHPTLPCGETLYALLQAKYTAEKFPVKVVLVKNGDIAAEQVIQNCTVETALSFVLEQARQSFGYGNDFEDSEFLCWALDKDNTIPLIPSEQVTKETVIYAIYKKNSFT